jgi:nucleoside 2-deoxyribosyltransferase
VPGLWEEVVYSYKDPLDSHGNPSQRLYKVRTDMMENPKGKDTTPEERTLDVYVAAPSADLALAEEMFSSLAHAGFDIAFYWTLDFLHNQKVLSSFPKTREEENNQESLANRISYDMVRGVRDADVVVLMCTGSPSVGMWVELGMAIALRKPIVIYAPEGAPYRKHGCSTNLFLHPDVCPIAGDAFSIYQVIEVLKAMKEKKFSSS